ncbi:hypothetical protein RHOSPDRAFT_37508 [Rhodotorula sp. JG-1b]|nr:hypothetical protein RHOSPDRAFT_37508 [Rhodotorula sp. JG-1b]
MVVALVVSSTSTQLCAITTSSPGLAFTHYHASLSYRQSTVLARLRTGACDLGAYKARYEHEHLICPCGSKPQTRKHFLLYCPPLRLPARHTPLLSLTQKHHP